MGVVRRAVPWASKLTWRKHEQETLHRLDDIDNSLHLTEHLHDQWCQPELLGECAAACGSGVTERQLFVCNRMLLSTFPRLWCFLPAGVMDSHAFDYQFAILMLSFTVATTNEEIEALN